MSDAPGWHAGHFYTVLDDPKLFGRREISFAPKFWCEWVKSLADFRSLHAGRKMAATAHVRILTCTS